MKVSAQNGRIVTEVPQKLYPGWVKIEERGPDGVLKNYRYRTPLGKLVSKDVARRAFAQIRARNANGASSEGHAPASRPDITTRPPSAPRSEAAVPALEVPAATTAPEPIEVTADKSKSGGLATGAQAAVTFAMGLIVLTSLGALLTGTGELAMSQAEAEGIAVPLGNLFAKSSLNKRYGRYVAEGGDYTALGYGLYAYAYRVGAQLNARRQQEQLSAPAGATPQAAQRGAPIHAVSQSSAASVARPAAPAGPAQQDARERSQPASGGIGAILRGDVPAEASRFVGHNPITGADRPA